MSDYRMIEYGEAVATVYVKRMKAGPNVVWESFIGTWDADTSSLRFESLSGPLVLAYGDKIAATYTHLAPPDVAWDEMD